MLGYCPKKSHNTAKQYSSSVNDMRHYGSKIRNEIVPTDLASMAKEAQNLRICFEGPEEVESTP